VVLGAALSVVVPGAVAVSEIADDITELAELVA
jgi:hypothetical protein